jgi:RNA polymerase sigma factor (sigma-70 family)
MMDPDTAIGGPNGRFPATRISAVEALRSPDAVERGRGYEALVASYWKPVYKYIRIKWRKSNEDAKDLTQAFFARAIEKDFLQPFDPAKAAFRTFLRACLDGFLANENRAAGRLKRGGDAITEPLDFDAAEGELDRQPVSTELSGEEYFHREWRRHLFGLAVEQLRRECQADGKAIRMRLFERYDLEEGDAATYEQLAAEFEIPVTQVTNALAAARRDFRRILLELDADVAL